MNERIAAIRSRVLRSASLPDPELQELRQEALAESAGQPAVVREARALAHYFRHRSLVIHDGELIVGAHPWVKLEPEGPVPARVRGRSTFTSPWPVPPAIERFFGAGMLHGAGNHTTLDYQTILSSGFLGLIERIQRRLSSLPPDEPAREEQRHFLEALRIVAEGYIDFCHRYADHAARLAQACVDGTRRRELETIAEHCRRVPAERPRTLWEACQAAWFAFFFLPDAPGRVDQYLYPFYRQDVERGTLTREFARELLSCLWLKYLERTGPQVLGARHHLTLGGVQPDGSDASNELTWLCLDVTEELRVLRPQVGLRCHRHTPPALLERAVRALRARTGHPDFCNDDQIVPALAATGIRWEDARDFSLSGCHEVIISGKSQMGSVEGFVNMPKILRLAAGLEPGLGDGVDLAAIDSYARLWERVVDAMDLVATAVHEASLCRDRLMAAQPGGNLAASLVTQDCIDHAKGYTQGGARYNHCNWDAIGVANLADSLAAMRALVFEERAVTLEALVEALRADWAGHESLRAQFRHRPAHFGNDDDTVDGIAAQIIQVFAAILKRRRPFRGGQYTLGTLVGAENMHVEFGRVTGATPDGRKAGEPFADSLGAAQGRDRRGVTAMLNSVAKLPHALLPTSTTVNVKLDPKLLEGDAGIEQVAALIRGHFRAGGQQLQFNFYNRELLLEAKRHPERYGDLMVRVAGYSAPFVALWGDLQDEIIARTEHSL